MTQRETFISAMAAMAGGVTIITTGRGENRGGLTATAMCSLSADPPSLLVCVNKRAAAHDLLLAEGYFAVNVLDSQHRDLALQFANTKLDAKGKFSGDSWGTLLTGVPVLKTAAAVFDCELDRAVDGYSHTILIGRVQGTLLNGELDDTGLVWHGRRFRGLIDFIQESAVAVED